MSFPADLIEQRISNYDQALSLLNKQLPRFKEKFKTWQNWHQSVTFDTQMQEVISQILVITYARMAMRNGSLSLSPRSYHNEGHIDDLLERLIQISKLPESKSMPDYGWSLLSLFMSSHDLRQSETKNNDDIIGHNEQASYQELLRLIVIIDKNKLLRQEHKELLKLMIHGSTFGEGKDVVGNVYQGNLVKYILQRVAYFDETDKQIAYLACHIDTANVAEQLKDYAQSSINVYKEIQTMSTTKISAQSFFGQQQEQYFFELQQFNSSLGLIAFAKNKSNNAPMVREICKNIRLLDKNMEDEKIIAYYQSHIYLHS
jgi:hypothetical protein